MTFRLFRTSRLPRAFRTRRLTPESYRSPLHPKGEDGTDDRDWHPRYSAYIGYYEIYEPPSLLRRALRLTADPTRWLLANALRLIVLALLSLLSLLTYGARTIRDTINPHRGA